MRIVVLGAGVVGLATAWSLLERGHQVTVVDRQNGGGLETSFGNGAQLSYAYVAPLASAATLAKLPSLLLARDAPIKIRPQLDLEFLRWGIGFLKACNATAERDTTAALLSLANLSRAEIARLSPSLGFDFDLGTPGKLIIFRDQKSFAAAARHAAVLYDWGVDQEIASPQRCLEIEPALRVAASELEGGVFTPSEQVGDCAAFCAGLARKLMRHPDVTWRMDETIEKPVVEGRRLRAVRTSKDQLEADAFVLCMASGSARFARSAKFTLPIQPMKGYSLTLRSRGRSQHLTRSVTDFDNKVVFAPLRQDDAAMVRIAGVADLVGPDLRLDEQRLSSIRRAARTVLDIDPSPDDQPWAGLRPATPDSRPLIGASPLENLFVNTGHGGLGWTLACGSARLTAELLDGAPTSISPKPFAVSRN
jgi:D-amino-acid dehydrogenase